MPLTAFTNTFAGNPLDRASDRRERSRLDRRPGWPIPRSLAVALWNGKPLVEDAPGPGRRCRSPTCRPTWRASWPAATSGCCSWACGRRPRSSPSTWRARRSRRRAAGRASGGSRTCGPIGAALPADRRGHPGHRQADVRMAPPPPLLRGLRPAERGHRRRLEARSARPASTEHFPRTDPVVIMLPTIGERCLLGRQAVWPKGMYLGPGRLPGARRDHRGGLRARAQRRGRPARHQGALPLDPALALSVVADDRPDRRGRERRGASPTRSSSTRCAGSPATRPAN